MENAPTVSALSYEGLSAITADGKPAQFASWMPMARSSPPISRLWTLRGDTAIAAYRKFLIDEGHLRVYTKAEAMALRASYESD